MNEKTLEPIAELMGNFLKDLSKEIRNLCDSEFQRGYSEGYQARVDYDSDK